MYLAIRPLAFYWHRRFFFPFPLKGTTGCNKGKKLTSKSHRFRFLQAANTRPRKWGARIEDLFTQSVSFIFPTSDNFYSTHLWQSAGDWNRQSSGSPNCKSCAREDINHSRSRSVSSAGYRQGRASTRSQVRHHGYNIALANSQTVGVRVDDPGLVREISVSRNFNRTVADLIEGSNVGVQCGSGIVFGEPDCFTVGGVGSSGVEVFLTFIDCRKIEWLVSYSEISGSPVNTYWLGYHQPWCCMQWRS